MASKYKIKTLEYQFQNSIPVFVDDLERLKSLFKRFSKANKFWEIVLGISAPLVVSQGFSMKIYDGTNLDIKIFYIVSFYVSIAVTILSSIVIFLNRKNDQVNLSDIETLIFQIFARGEVIKPISKQNITNSDNKQSSIKLATKPIQAVINIPKGTPQSRLVELNKLLQVHRGNVKTTLLFKSDTSERLIDLPFGLDWNRSLEDRIKELLDNGNSLTL